jgi:hypothetical protein
MRTAQTSFPIIAYPPALFKFFFPQQAPAAKAFVQLFVAMYSFKKRTRVERAGAYHSRKNASQQLQRYGETPFKLYFYENSLNS